MNKILIIIIAVLVVGSLFAIFYPSQKTSTPLIDIAKQHCDLEGVDDVFVSDEFIKVTKRLSKVIYYPKEGEQAFSCLKEATDDACQTIVKETNWQLVCDNEVVNSFADCVLAGNPIMESFPRKCKDGNVVFTEDIVLCNNESRKADACITVYDPVCAAVSVQCVTAPCYPVKETFSNSCEACRNSLVTFYQKGECK